MLQVSKTFQKSVLTTCSARVTWYPPGVWSQSEFWAPNLVLVCSRSLRLRFCTTRSCWTNGACTHLNEVGLPASTHASCNELSLYVSTRAPGCTKSGQPFRIRTGEHLNVESSFLLCIIWRGSYASSPALHFWGREGGGYQVSDRISSHDGNQWSYTSKIIRVWCYNTGAWKMNIFSGGAYEPSNSKPTLLVWSSSSVQ